MSLSSVRHRANIRQLFVTSSPLCTTTNAVVIVVVVVVDSGGGSAVVARDGSGGGRGRGGVQDRSEKRAQFAMHFRSSLHLSNAHLDVITYKGSEWQQGGKEEGGEGKERKQQFAMQKQEKDWEEMGRETWEGRYQIMGAMDRARSEKSDKQQQQHLTTQEKHHGAPVLCIYIATSCTKA